MTVVCGRLDWGGLAPLPPQLPRRGGHIGGGLFDGFKGSKAVAEEAGPEVAHVHGAEVGAELLDDAMADEGAVELCFKAAA